MMRRNTAAKYESADEDDKAIYDYIHNDDDDDDVYDDYDKDEDEKTLQKWIRWWQRGKQGGRALCSFPSVCTQLPAMITMTMMDEGDNDSDGALVMMTKCFVLQNVKERINKKTSRFL